MALQVQLKLHATTLALMAAFLILGSAADDDADNPAGASVSILNAGNETILVHCQSKDSDIGALPVDPGAEYAWQFHPNIFGMTLYSCQFFWKAMTQNFQVWKGSYYDDRPPCAVKGPCRYKAAADGFYYELESGEDGGGGGAAADAWEFYQPWLPNPMV